MGGGSGGKDDVEVNIQGIQKEKSGGQLGSIMNVQTAVTIPEQLALQCENGRKRRALEIAEWRHKRSSLSTKDPMYYGEWAIRDYLNEIEEDETIEEREYAGGKVETFVVVRSMMKPTGNYFDDVGQEYKLSYYHPEELLVLPGDEDFDG